MTRLDELTAIRRPLTSEEIDEVIRMERRAKFRERYWTDEAFRRAQSEKRRKYRGRGYR